MNVDALFDLLDGVVGTAHCVFELLLQSFIFLTKQIGHVSPNLGDATLRIRLGGIAFRGGFLLRMACAFGTCSDFFFTACLPLTPLFKPPPYVLRKSLEQSNEFVADERPNLIAEPRPKEFEKQAAE